MKMLRTYYNDNGILLPGLMIQRVFRKRLFIPFDSRSTFTHRYIQDKKKLIPYTRKSYQTFYKNTYHPGTCIMLLCKKSEMASIPAGTIGHVDHVDDAGTLHCIFSHNRSLTLTPGLDVFRIMENLDLY